MQEIWKPIPDCDYEVSNTGNVRSLYKTKAPKTLKVRVHEKGYLYVVIYRNNKPVPQRIHRLVAEAFIDNPNDYYSVNHKNGIKTDNRSENLEWCTHKSNVHHAILSGLSKFKLDILTVRVIKSLKGDLTSKQIAQYFKINQNIVKRIFTGERWAWIF